MVGAGYNKKVLEHFLNPRNMGKMDDADGVGEAGNPVCGDIMFLYIKVDEKTDRITDIKFETMGCAAAIATSSVLTEMVKGKTIEEALRITFNDIVRELGGLPSIKLHCSNLAVDALKNAIDDYKKRSGYKKKI